MTYTDHFMKKDKAYALKLLQDFEMYMLGAIECSKRSEVEKAMSYYNHGKTLLADIQRLQVSKKLTDEAVEVLRDSNLSSEQIRRYMF